MKVKKLARGLSLAVLAAALCLIMVFAGFSNSSAHSISVPFLQTGTVNILSANNGKAYDTEYTLTQNFSNGTVLVDDNIKTKNGALSLSVTYGSYTLTSNADSAVIKSFYIGKGKATAQVTLENNTVCTILKNAQSVCIIGDSITAGSATNGHGWHEKLINNFPNIIHTETAAKGGETSASIFENTSSIQTIENSTADTYIIALGVNEVISWGKSTPAATTATDYLNNLQRIVDIINSNAADCDRKIIFVSPFTYADKQPADLQKYLSFDNANQEYIAALNSWCIENSYPCVNIMNYVDEFLNSCGNKGDYMENDLHPSYPNGTDLYSDAFLAESLSKSTGALKIKQTFYKETKEKDSDDTTYETVNATNADEAATSFTVQDSKTGQYVQASAADTQYTYNFKELSSGSTQYNLTAQTNYITIENLPTGSYTVTFIKNSADKTPYRISIIMYVTGGTANTTAEIPMKY